MTEPCSSQIKPPNIDKKPNPVRANCESLFTPVCGKPRLVTLIWLAVFKTTFFACDL